MENTLGDADSSSKKLTEIWRIFEDKDFVSVIPESVVEYYLRQAGCEVGDPKVVRMVALDLQHYMQDILEDVKKLSALKTEMKSYKRQKVEKEQEEEAVFSLENSELESVLRDRKVSVSRAPFHAS